MATKTKTTLPLENRLLSAVTQYDAKLEARQPNMYRLGIILKQLDKVYTEIAEGKSVARALYDNFSDRLLTALEKAAGVPVTYGGGAKSKGRPE